MKNILYTMSSSQGYLKVILGPMFSGKTTQLIRIYKHNQIAEIPTLVINYSEDDRYSNINLSTHDRIEIPCVKLTQLNEIYPYLSQGKNYKTILINEGQFFEDLYCVVKNLVETHSLNVFVAGLDGDYKMQRFGQMLDLIPIANDVKKLHAICKYCKKPAAFTKRISKETAQKVIGDIDKYVPVCRMCYS